MSSKVFSSLRVWEYRDTAVPSTALTTIPEQTAARAAPGFTEAQVCARIEAALAEAEVRWANDSAEGESRRKAQLRSALDEFAEQRARYFRNAESEVVHLALAIAKKILGREARQDPDLLAALVRIALDRMGAAPAVRLRLPASDMAQWQKCAEFAETRYACEQIVDPSLKAGECVVETNLGRANFGFEAQLKEIEQGMLALVELRPGDRAEDSVEGRAEERVEDPITDRIKPELAAPTGLLPARSSIQAPAKAA